MAFFTFTALLVLGASAPAAPVGHDIFGKITDSTGAGLGNVRVVVLEANRAILTDAGGNYRFVDVADGTYGISFSYVGYTPVVRRITLAGQDLELNVRLQQSFIELPPLQTTATPLATTTLTSPQPTGVVAGTELRTAQAPTLGETLTNLAGVHSLSTGIGIGKPVIRGLTSNRVLVLDNGQRLETQQWGDEHGPNVETATAERIEVIRGPASVLYGSDALGGVINVVPRNLPIAEGGTTLAHGSLTAGYGTNNRQPEGVLLLEGAKGGFGFRATGSGRTSRDLKTPDYTLWNSANQAVAGSGAVGYRGSRGSITATFSQRNEKVFLTDEDPAETPIQRIATSRGRVDFTLPLGGTRLEGNVGYERNRRREFAEKTSPDVALGLLSRTFTGGLHVHHPPLGNLAGIIGVSGLRNSFDKFGEETLIPNSTAYTIGAFGFEQLETGRWSFTFGARFDHRHLAVENDAELGVSAQSRNWTSVTGNVGALFHLAEPVALVLNVGRGYRAPSSFDLFANGVHEGTISFERGDPTLRNETSLNTDLALRVQSSRVLLEVGGFANLINDFIYTVPSGETDPASGLEIFNTTQGNARLIGFEASFQYHPIRALHFQGTADYTRGQNTTTDQPLPLIPPFRATYSLRLEGTSRGSLLEPYLLVGGESNARQSRQDPSEAEFYAQAFDGAGYRSVGYSLAHAGVGAGLLLGGTVLRVDLTLRNAFNKRYANYLSRIKTIAENPGMGRNLTVKVSSEF
jgi:iron complex outermembrane receptor protein